MPPTLTATFKTFIASTILPVFLLVLNNKLGTDIDSDTANQTFTQFLEKFSTAPFWMQCLFYVMPAAVALYFFYIVFYIVLGFCSSAISATNERCCMTKEATKEAKIEALFKKLAEDEELDEEDFCTLQDEVFDGILKKEKYDFPTGVQMRMQAERKLRMKKREKKKKKTSKDDDSIKKRTLPKLRRHNFIITTIINMLYCLSITLVLVGLSFLILKATGKSPVGFLGIFFSVLGMICAVITTFISNKLTNEIGALKDDDSIDRGKDTSDTINILVKDQSGDETFFKVKKTTKMSKVFTAYAQRKGIAITSLCFLLDGDIIDAGDTPKSLDLEDQVQSESSQIPFFSSHCIIALTSVFFIFIFLFIII